MNIKVLSAKEPYTDISLDVILHSRSKHLVLGHRNTQNYFGQYWPKIVCWNF